MGQFLPLAFVGAAVASVAVHAHRRRIGRDGATPVKLAVAGAAFSAGLASWTTRPAPRPDRADDGVLPLLAGRHRSAGVGTDVLLAGLPFLVVGAAAGARRRAPLNTLALGDDMARGLGRRTTRDRARVGLAIVLLAGTATALAGPIAFVGLDRAPRRTRPRRPRPPPAAAAQCWVGAVAGGPRRHRRPRRAAALGGAGRDHGRRRRRARSSCPDPPHREGDVTVTLGRPVTTEPPTPSTPDALDVVRRARRAPVRHRRRLLAGLLVALVGAFAVRVLLGDYTFTVPDFFRILFGEQIPGATFILMESKLPRAVLAVLVGVALRRRRRASSRCTLRNPLASPDIVGVSLGASAAAHLRGARPRPAATAAGLAVRGRRCRRRRARRARGRRRPPAASGSCWSASASRPRCCRSSSTSSPASTTYDVQLGAALARPAASTASPGRRSALLAARAGRAAARHRVGWPARCRHSSWATTPPPGWASVARRTDVLLLVGVLLVAVGRGRGRPGRVRGLHVRADRPRPHRWAYDAARRPALVGAVHRAGRPTTRRLRSSPTSTCPSASSPGPSAHRSCSGCWRAAPQPGRSRHDHRQLTEPARLEASASRSATATPTSSASWTCEVPDGAGHRHRRRQRLRQVHAAARAGPAAAAAGGAVLLDGEAIHRLPDQGGRHGRWGCCRRTRSRPRASPSPTWSAAGATRTTGVFGRWTSRGRRGGRRGARPHRHPRARRPRRRRALGRPAPAGLDRDGARAGHRPAAARRADDLPRRRPPGRDARPARRAQRRAAAPRS